MQKLLRDPLVDEHTEKFHLFGEACKLVPCVPSCEPGAFRTFEICALFKIKYAFPSEAPTTPETIKKGSPDRPRSWLRRVASGIGGHALERIQTIGTQYIWSSEVAEPPGPKTWLPMALRQEKAGADSPSQTGQCSIISSVNYGGYGW
jgi:hypothetical protein